ncbi:crosslink repair DNA glycosylase YcaQ family protein [Actinopolymorpha sp. B17G11]|uniref:winged helix-turn-helix domain-containing protein n=1 Tax=Actinopolymorpha sp. B17G11 TaxID=3160861 RepID=UPI0032E38E26
MESQVRGRPPEQITVETARRIALAAQGFADPRPSGRVDARHLRRVIDRVGVLQLDSVNVLCRSHYLPVFARLGPYPRDLLDQMAWGSGRRRALFEYWGHAASLLPLQTYPLVRWRMEAAQRWVWDGWTSARVPGRPPPDYATTWDDDIIAPWAVIEGMTRLTLERPGLVHEVLDRVTAHGAIAAGAASPDGRRSSGPTAEGGRMWNWQDAKIALEWLFCTGAVTTATRNGFERIYDRTERVLPAAVLNAPAPNPTDAQRELVRIAARAQGIATEKQLRTYFDLSRDQAKARIAELVETGELAPVRVDGLAQRMYLWTEARMPRRVTARALLSPFDSLIWDRDRALRLFDFHYRISIYTPAAKRTHGYYVLPFLLGDRLVARVDLKADRQQSALLVQAAFGEPGVREDETSAELAEELRAMADWLTLDRVLVSERGDLAPALSRAISMPRRRTEKAHDRSPEEHHSRGT